MRKILLVVLMAFCTMQAPFFARAGTFDAQGKFQGPVDARVTEIFSRFPNGGAEFEGALFNLLMANRDDINIGNDVAFMASDSKSLGQRTSAGTALGRAVKAMVEDCMNAANCSLVRLAVPGQITEAIRLTGNADVLRAASAATGYINANSGMFVPPAGYETNTNYSYRTVCTPSPC